MRLLRFSLSFGFSLLLPTLPAFADFTSSTTDRVSAGTFSGATESNAASSNPAFSKNGRFVVFESTATNLIDYLATTASRRHIYLLDRQAGTLEIVDQTLTGTEIGSDAFAPSVSDDGRYVAYTTSASASTIVSVCKSDFCHVNKLFAGHHVYVRDRLANENMMADQVTLSCKQQQLKNGVPQTVEVVECDSTHPNCDLSDETQTTKVKAPVMEVVPKRVSGVVVPSTSAVSSNPALSGDGRYVAFDTDADNLAGTVGEPLIPDPIEGVDYNVGGVNDGIINDVNYLTCPTGVFIDGNDVRDVYVRDGQEFKSKMVSLGCKYHAPEGCAVQGTADSIKPSISDDGTFVAFHSTTSFLDLDFNGVSDVFLIEREKMFDEVANLHRVSNTTNRLLAGNGASINASLSGDGRYVAFQSAASNLVSGDTNAKSDIFIYDKNFFSTVRCVTSSGAQTDADATIPNMSGNGTYLTLQSAATNWGATGGFTNVYSAKLTKDTLGRLSACTVSLASIGSGTGGNGNSTNARAAVVPQTSGSGSSLVRTLVPAVAFESAATNLNSGTDSNAVNDIFESPNCTSRDATTDTDGDGTTDCFDQCVNDPLKVVDADSDGDGVADCEDGCATDAQKSGPGICGCGAPDTDSDGDGTADCKDSCPSDKFKTAAGACGCGIADTDADGDGIADCKESTNPTATPSASGSGTPTSSVTPSPTPANFSQVTPVTATITRLDAHTVEVRMSSRGATLPVARYRVVLVHRSTNKTFTKTKNRFRLAKLHKGSYRIKYTLIATTGDQSHQSALSKAFTIR